MSDDDLIRRGDALRAADEELRRYGFTAPEGRRFDMRDRLAALPARGVGVPTDPRPANCRFRLKDEGKSYGRSSCSACGRSVFTGLGTSCHLAALAPTDAAHVNETPKSEHDAGNVLTDAAQAREAAMQELIDAYEDIIDYGPLVLAKKDQWERVRVAKEKLK